MQALRHLSTSTLFCRASTFGRSTAVFNQQLHVAGLRQLSSSAAAMTEVSPEKHTEKKTAKKRVPRPRKAVLEVSDRAADRVAELMSQKDPRPVGIRLGVRTRGCNGLSYTMNYLDEAPKLDDVVETNGVKVFIDPKAVMFLLGSRMDFVEDAVRAEFVFENPNAKGSCGCGESFNV